ncbi:glycoside hydrolase family 13 protein [Frankia sp. CIT1]|uniref:glycoside hydrolase family 13 protein n=1 Tax=Frankia sp. CIT1 TaxID=2880974 RepID=UPI001EF6966B|nr:glycoside hydrolase family 13 protein [Frankia sp. CIT1]
MEPSVEIPSGGQWWRNAVLYEVYVRSFADSDGDGVGDLAGVRSRLDYLRNLGVDGIWLTPFYPSPMADHGYDVADHRDVDPLFGDLATFDALLRDAHSLGLKVLLDLVPNHSSDRHPAFQAALASPPGSPERQLYVFRDGSGPDGALPPNNWVSVFGGPAWARLPIEPPEGSESGGPPDPPPSGQPRQPRQWYLHLFAAEQPDWNWSHPQVREDHERTLRFWLDRGVDGFRIDVAHGLVKDAELRDNPAGTELAPHTAFRDEHEPHVWDQDGVHEIYRGWRRLFDEYDHRDGRDRVLVGETWVADPDRLARYVRPDELHLTFAFSLLTTPWSAAAWQAAVRADLAATARHGCAPTWVLANHDVVRPATRYGAGEAGMRRARAALLTMLALPGAVFLYQGDELCLPQADVAAQWRQDPVWRRSGGTSPGRDGARVPMPWAGQSPPFGFAPPGVTPWLPQPPGWVAFSVEAQAGDTTSALVFTREGLRLRRALPAFAGSVPDTLRWREDTPPGCLAFDRLPPSSWAGPTTESDSEGEHHDGGMHDGRRAQPPIGGHTVTCVMSTADVHVQLMVPGRLALASNPVTYNGTTITLPPDTAAWVIATHRSPPLNL